MRSELFEAVEEETRKEFELLAELGQGAGWAAFLGRRRGGRRTLALLVLRAAEEDGEFDLETLDALDDRLPLGWSTCPGCGSRAEGWPRGCPACRTDLTGVEADDTVAGGSAAELLDEVRAAASGVYDVLGAMPYEAGGGPLYFACAAASGRVVGLALRDAGHGELDLDEIWTSEDDAAPAQPAYARLDEYDDDGSGIVDDGADVFPEDEERRAWREPPPPRRGETGRRAAGIGAIAVTAVALVGAAVFAIVGPGSATDAADRNAFADTTAGPETAAIADSAADAPGGIGQQASGGEAFEHGSHGTPPPPNPPTPSPGGRERPHPPKEEGTSAGTGGSASPAPPPVAETAPAPTLDGIEEAIGRYAAAVQSRQTSRISRAYPGITPAEVDRWERFFRPLRPDAEVRTRYDVLSGPTLNGTRGEILFTLTVSYTDAAGRPATLPLPLRGVFAWKQGGWSLEEVRSYP